VVQKKPSARPDFELEVSCDLSRIVLLLQHPCHMPTLTPYLASNAPQHRPPIPEPKAATWDSKCWVSPLMIHPMAAFPPTAASAAWLSLPMITTSVSCDRASPASFIGTPTSVSTVLAALQSAESLRQLLGLGVRGVSEYLALGLLARCLAAIGTHEANGRTPLHWLTLC
jgi:hypothetical protein